MKVKYLSEEAVILINKLTTEQHSGRFDPPSNLFRPGALKYVTESVKATVFGTEIYSTITDKAAAYMFGIINNHVFHDGNKRTGLEAASVFLRANNYGWTAAFVQIDHHGQKIPREAKADDGDKQLEYFTLEVAGGIVDLEGCKAWFAANTTIRRRPPE